METIALDFKGDKSLSHRSAILSALGTGRFEIKNFLTAGDTLNTLYAMKNLGITIEGDEKTGSFSVISKGLSNLPRLEFTADLGNSGTGSRLLLGLLSGLKDTQVVITGDESLKKRPMARITTPLASAGARFEPSDKLPITVYGKTLLPIMHVESIGSAQVKSALMLAAISSQTSLRLEEKIPSRDHTENMLRFCGVNLLKEPLENGGFLIEMEPPYEINPVCFDIWGDISSASFFIVLGLLNNHKVVHIRNVLLNPYRDRFLKILQAMGGKIEIIKKDPRCGEEGGDIIAYPSRLHGIEIDPADIPAIIDELPVLTIAGLLSNGKFSFRGAEELRHKESDRITAMVQNLKGLGYQVEEYPDGLTVIGNPDKSFTGNIESFMDHRIVMSFEILQSVWKINGYPEKLDISGKQWVETSFPDFYSKLGLFL